MKRESLRSGLLSFKKCDLETDIYFSDEYISLYLNENEDIFSFNYREENHYFVNKTIKRAIKKIGNVEVEDGFYDLESAYGYGGFYSNSEDSEFLKRAFKSYEKKCVEEGVIAEFIRFHPFNNFSVKNQEFLDFNLYDRDVVVKDLRENVYASYSAKVRNTVKRASEKTLFRESENVDKFKLLYDETMRKNSANNFYFFSKEYYKKLLKNKKIKLYELLYESEVVAMGIFMFSDTVAHYHLSANTATSYSINANYALLHNVFEVAKSMGVEYFLLGGGSTPFPDDSLLKFKKKFSKELKPFYIAGKIYNREVYDRYNMLWDTQSREEVKYFLKYRLEIK